MPATRKERPEDQLGLSDLAPVGSRVAPGQTGASPLSVRR